MKINKLVKRFIIGTFVSLYALVSVISTIHVIDFFELSNPYWLAVTLAIGFEIGAAASLASLVILDKMNKTIVWSLFITITLMQMQGNMFYAFINLGDFSSWSELFNLIEEDLIYQKRILAFVSGAILPLVALGFIKSLVDYIKPGNDEDELVTDGSLGDEYFNQQEPDKDPGDFEDMVEDWEAPINIEDDISDWDDTLLDGLEDEEFVDGADDEDIVLEEEGYDEDHALDQVLNDMVKDMDFNDMDDDIYTVGELEADESTKPIDYTINPTSVGATVQKMNTSHLPQDEQSLLNEALRKKAQENKDSFIKGKGNDS